MGNMRKILIFSILGIILMTSFATSIPGYESKTPTNIQKQNSNEYRNITAEEAWEMMSSDDDGRQILIDIRRWEEYSAERIEPPNPKDWPRWFPYELESGGPGPIKNEGVLLHLFMKIYRDKEIIIYCRTGRRTAISAQILVNHGFSGIVYNMVNGITEWKQIGLPVAQGFLRSG
jgi:rhodanese-related sulfurtransferase